ncbi:MAG TPA: hypothetical protein VFM80_10055 [Gracilimonas sp.]|uniref:hypothetical protein n=1 Tax=Gracilimonas sp. TaxID=1974203 RepID=UPI002D89FE68|nr:hypothetical protein [Gracilimonas sp.]
MRSAENILLQPSRLLLIHKKDANITLMFQGAHLPEHGLGFCQNWRKNITKTIYLEAETMANKSQKPAPKSAPKATAKKQATPVKKAVKK